MTPPLQTPDLHRFRAAVAAGLGLQFDDSKLEFLAGVLQSRLQCTGQSVALYLAYLEGGADQEIGCLARALTIGESYFFRNDEQFRALAEVVLPARQRASAPRPVRILSAGCASGEEAYSIAAVAADGVGLRSVSIRAVDLNPDAIDRARCARYTAWALREMPRHTRQRWFTTDDNAFVLEPALVRAVHFDVRNLLDEALWEPESLDVVFVRNVLMYFTGDHQRQVMAFVARALMPGGHLFLGHAETLRGLSHDFHLCHTHDTFYYQRRGAGIRPAPRRAPLRPLDAGAEVASAVDSSGSWVEAIGRASERIERLTEATRTAAPLSRPPAQTRRRAAWDLDAPRLLLREERFAEALAMVRELPPESRHDPDVLLLDAALLTHRGALEEAERTCRRLLEIDDMSAGAHYLLALCREGTHAFDEAAHHDQTAAYLDPTFAMPHLHLGLLARRRGDVFTCRRELEQALQLLDREEASRLLLFGGGFGREALMSLCRTELAAVRARG